jgi:hypothetical protein
MRKGADAFYAWTALDDGRGSCGVTGDPDRAVRLLHDAISELAPGATGSIQIVRVDPCAWPAAYVHGRVLVRVRRNEAGG